MTANPPVTITRDIVAIGCSAGGVDALPRILQQLPRDLEAAIVIVQHMAATSTPYLIDILGRASQLPVVWAEQGARIERGCVVVGPPDVHLLFSDDRVHLSKGARENHARPSIDKLFRSAAATHGSRVIGVLLTGMLDDGVAGLQAIQQAGGVVIVQDPSDAAFPELPGRALLALAPDRTLPLDAIGAAIIELVGEHVPASAPPRHLAIETAIDQEDQVSPDRMTAIGSQAEVETALWSAVRALGDRATTLETLASDAARVGSGQSAEVYRSRAREARYQAELARRFMLDLGRTS